jgi:hypothetical protein
MEVLPPDTVTMPISTGILEGTLKPYQPPPELRLKELFLTLLI